MANNTIYPYGLDGEAPSGFIIVDNLTTGGRTKALSAEQGKVLRRRIRAMSETQYQALSQDDKDLVVAIITEDDAPIPPSGDYVTRGLILQLSGKSGMSASGWTPTVGNNPYTVRGDVTLGQEKFTFGGSGGLSGNTVYAPQDSSTLEIAFEITSFGNSWNMLFTTNAKTNTSRICAAIKSGQLIWTTSNEKIYTGTISTGKHTLSVNASRALLDGVALTKSNDENYIGNTVSDFSSIGAVIYKSGDNYMTPFSMAGGSIYAVRVYNRLLSADEMVHNQAVDNEEYDLGLTINEE